MVCGKRFVDAIKLSVVNLGKSSVPVEDCTLQCSPANKLRLNVTIWVSLRLRAAYHESALTVLEIKDERAMDRLVSDSRVDTKGDLLLAIGVGFLINLIIGV